MIYCHSLFIVTNGLLEDGQYNNCCDQCGTGGSRFVFESQCINPQNESMYISR
jgi:hypothetical protein